MNERIRELATEVGISVDYLTNTKQIVLLEKFAELIVRECALTAGLMEHEGRLNIGRQILDNFGVEL
jgi:hypothetical protein